MHRLTGLPGRTRRGCGPKMRLVSGYDSVLLGGGALDESSHNGYKVRVVTIRARAVCCCTEARWAPELTVVSR